MTTKKVSSGKVRPAEKFDPYDLVGAVEDGKKLTEKQKDKLLDQVSGAWANHEDLPELFEAYIKNGVLEPRHRKMLKKPNK